MLSYLSLSDLSTNLAQVIGTHSQWCNLTGTGDNGLHKSDTDKLLKKANKNNKKNPPATTTKKKKTKQNQQTNKKKKQSKPKTKTRNSHALKCWDAGGWPLIDWLCIQNKPSQIKKQKKKFMLMKRGIGDRHNTLMCFESSLWKRLLKGYVNSSNCDSSSKGPLQVLLKISLCTEKGTSYRFLSPYI